MAAKSESPVEPFKRAIAHAARSLAEQPDLEVVFYGDGPSLEGHRATLPNPPKDLPPAEAARIRGLADQMALRLAHHDEAAHAKLRPYNSAGAQLFEAVEQARVDAIGANALDGVRQNLAALLESQLEKKGLTRAADRTAVPLAETLALMVRERLTGDPPPHGARQVVDLVRDEIEQKAGADLDQLAAQINDQQAFGRILRRVVADLELGDESPDLAEDAREDEEEDQAEPDEGDGEESGEDDAQSEGSSQDKDSADPDAQQAQDQAVQVDDADDIEVRDDAPELGEGVKPARPDIRDPGRAEPAYKVFTTAHDEVVDAEDLCDAE